MDGASPKDVLRTGKVTPLMPTTGGITPVTTATTTPSETLPTFSETATPRVLVAQLEGHSPLSITARRLPPKPPATAPAEITPPTREIVVSEQFVRAMEEEKIARDAYLRALVSGHQHDMIGHSLHRKLKDALDSLDRIIEKDGLPQELKIFAETERKEILERSSSELIADLKRDRMFWIYKKVDGFKLTEKPSLKKLREKDPEKFMQLFKQLQRISIPVEKGKGGVRWVRLLDRRDLESLDFTLVSAKGFAVDPDGRRVETSRLRLQEPDGGFEKKLDSDPEYLSRVCKKMEQAILLMKRYSAETGLDKEITDELIDIWDGRVSDAVLELAKELSSATRATGERPDYIAELELFKAIAKETWDIIKMPYYIYQFADFLMSDDQIEETTPFQEALMRSMRVLSDDLQEGVRYVAMGFGIAALVMNEIGVVGEAASTASEAATAAKTAAKISRLRKTVRTLGSVGEGIIDFVWISPRTIAKGFKLILRTGKAGVRKLFIVRKGSDEILPRPAEAPTSSPYVRSPAKRKRTPVATRKKKRKKEVTAKPTPSKKIMPLDKVADAALIEAANYYYRKELRPRDMSAAQAKTLLEQKDVIVVARDGDHYLFKSRKTLEYNYQGVYKGKPIKTTVHYFPDKGLYYDDRRLFMAGEFRREGDVCIIKLNNGSYKAFRTDPATGKTTFVDQLFLGEPGKIGLYYAHHTVEDAIVISDGKLLKEQLRRTTPSEGSKIIILRKTSDGKLEPVRKEFLGEYSIVTDSNGSAYRTFFWKIKGKIAGKDKDFYIVQKPDHRSLGKREYDVSGDYRNFEIFVKEGDRFRPATSKELKTLTEPHLRKLRESKLFKTSKVKRIGEAKKTRYKTPKREVHVFEQEVEILTGRKKYRVNIIIEASSRKRFESKFSEIKDHIEQQSAVLFKRSKKIVYLREEAKTYGYGQADGHYDYNGEIIRVFKFDTGVRFATGKPKAPATLRHELGHGMHNIVDDDLVELQQRIIVATRSGGESVQRFYEQHASAGKHYQSSWRERFAEAVEMFLNPEKRQLFLENDPMMASVIDDLISGRIKGETEAERAAYNKLRGRILAGTIIGLTVTGGALVWRGYNLYSK